MTQSLPLLLMWLILKVEKEGEARQSAPIHSSAACPAASAAFCAFLWTVPQMSLLHSLPLIVDPNVYGTADEQPQNSLQQSIRPSVREAEQRAGADLIIIF